MNNFLKTYFEFTKKLLNEKYKKIVMHIIDIDEFKKFKYEDKESPLHNSVNFLNQNLLNQIDSNINLLEIGCGAKSIFFESKEKIFDRVDGLDVHEIDFRGRTTLANIIGSVSNIPTKSNFYDICISNQSIEHWYEYGVSLSLGLSEISRIIKKDNGKMIINFPLFLHGKREFVQGNIEKILEEISKFFVIQSITFIYSSKRVYKGWELCGQSSFRVKRYLKYIGINESPQSIVCEVIGSSRNNIKEVKKVKSINKKRFINVYKDYTFYELFLKIMKKLNFNKL